MPTMNKHTPERFPRESQTDYRARRRESHDANIVRIQVLVPPVSKGAQPQWAWEIVAPSRNGGHGAQMAAVRAARKRRNVKRHRKACRG